MHDGDITDGAEVAVDDGQTVVVIVGSLQGDIELAILLGDVLGTIAHTQRVHVDQLVALDAQAAHITAVRRGIDNAVVLDNGAHLAEVLVRFEADAALLHAIAVEQRHIVAHVDGHDHTVAVNGDDVVARVAKLLAILLGEDARKIDLARSPVEIDDVGVVLALATLVEDERPAWAFHLDLATAGGVPHIIVIVARREYRRHCQSQQCQKL